MTISIRNDWLGNTPHAQFEHVDHASAYIQNNPSYEIISDGKVRPYGDLDFEVADTITEQEFNTLNDKVYSEMVLLADSADQRITMLSASSYSSRKISWNWVFPDLYVSSRHHAKEFAVKLYSQCRFPEGLVLDYSVYSSGRKMRMIGTSKPDQNRPKKIVITFPYPWSKPSIADSMITYVPDNAEFVDIQLPQKDTPRERTIVEETVITQIADQIKNERWKDYSTCLKLIYALCSAGASDNTIHHYCSKVSNYETKWVDGVIKSYDSAKSQITVGTLIYYAKLDNPAFKVPRTNQSHFEEITQLTLNDNTILNHKTSQGFLKKLPYHPTQAVSSHMSTGKSHEMIRICGETKGTVLMLAVRCSWTSSFKAELPTFVDYRDVKAKQISNDKNLIIQLQSLHRIEGNTYDTVFLDEIESLLATLSPNETHGKKYHENIQVLESIIRSAKRVVGLDAFLTDRSVRFLEALRGEVQIIINPHQPFSKTGKIYKSKREYLATLTNQLKKGKKIYTVWGAKKDGLEYHTFNSKNQVFYAKGINEKLKHTHLTDVNTCWADIQHVGSTATITVGVNYTNTEKQFDMCSFYGSAWSSIARDYFQALHRARKLNDDYIFGFVSDSRPCNVESGLAIQAKMFDENTKRKIEMCEDLGEPLIDYTTLPAWLKDILIWNRNEIITSRLHFEECMIGYGKLCGIDFTLIGEKDKRIKVEKQDIVDVDTVRDICENEADYLLSNRKSITIEQHFELEKYFLSTYVSYMNQDVWKMWLTNRKWIERTYVMKNSTAKHELEKQQDKVIELIPTDIEKLDVIQNKWKFDFTTSWSIPVEELTEVSMECFNLRIRSDKDTKDQYARNIKKAMNDWNNTILHVDRTRVRKGGVLEYEYVLRYDAEENMFYKIVSNKYSGWTEE